MTAIQSDTSRTTPRFIGANSFIEPLRVTRPFWHEPPRAVRVADFKLTRYPLLQHDGVAARCLNRFDPVRFLDHLGQRRALGRLAVDQEYLLQAFGDGTHPVDQLFLIS